MDAGKDPKGYYARLNVAPSASADAIKAAYRQLAKKLHPDVNRDAAAKAQFQAISEAYNVLSSPDLRSKYDALRYANPPPRPRAQELDPICCSRCGRVTAQPRSTVFYRVVSVLFVTTRTPIQGIFCSECANKIGLQASLIAGLFGWWGFPWGPIWTIGSILGNAFGGKYTEDVDEKLLWYNALAFLSKGKLAISYALAQQARTARDAKIAINAVKLMDHLRAAGVPAASPMLKNPWRAKPLSVVLHLALLIAVPGVIGLAIYSDNAKSGLYRYPSSPPYQTAQPSHSSPSLNAAAPSPPTRAVENTAPIPTCSFPPTNGEVLAQHGVWNKKGHSIEITNGSGGNAIIKVRDAYTGSLAVSFFVVKGATASIINVPDGTYRIQYAFGGDLQSDCHSFVRVTSAAQFPDIESLRTRYTPTEIVRSRLSYTLFSVPDGNVRPQALDIAAFNAD
jgi:DnaJ domain